MSNNRVADWRIWKYVLTITDEQQIEVPAGRVLSVGEQGGDVCIWIHVQPSAPTTPLYFRIVGTGNPTSPIENLGRFIGTVQQLGGALVWHVFVAGEPTR
jgi:hypothetical protein